ncbi:MAG: HD domain-containing phosphohydrolase [Acidobacteriota bacterium]
MNPQPNTTSVSQEIARHWIGVGSQRILILLLGVVATTAGVATLNRAGSVFEVAGGVALIFPASAVAVLAGLFLRWWGVGAVFIGYCLTPWGLSTTPGRIVFFAFAATLQAVIPALWAGRPRGSEFRCIHFVGAVAILPTLVSALVALPALILLSQPQLSSGQAFVSFSGWFLGDLIAVMVLAVPVILALRPDLVLVEEFVRLYRGWIGSPATVAKPIMMIVTILIAMELTLRYALFGVHWIAALLLIPILWAAVRGGVGAALQINALAGMAYVVQVVRIQGHQEGMGLFAELFSSYLNLLVFVGAALVVGLAWGRADSLVRELDEHRRLLQENFERVVTALAAAVEAKDPLTQGHVQRVARLAVAVGKEMGLVGPRLEMLRFAALLHDVGKIGVPENILNKAGPLSLEERELIERHVTVGVEIIESVDILGPAIPFIRYHQERWDGGTDARTLKYPGYFGLKGEEIPLEARIIAVVDTWDAITSDRPYRKAQSSEIALEELQAEAGKQFDPEVVEAVQRIVSSRNGVSSSDRIPIIGEKLPKWVSD